MFKVPTWRRNKLSCRITVPYLHSASIAAILHVFLITIHYNSYTFSTVDSVS